MHNIVEPLISLAVDINTVKIDPRNARTGHNLEKIGNSLISYGQRKPIVVNSRTNIIEAGNGAYQAARNLGWEKIAVVFVDDDPSAATGYAIADNQVGEYSDWDNEILEQLLTEIDSDTFSGFDLGEFEEMNTIHESDEKTSKRKRQFCQH